MKVCNKCQVEKSAESFSALKTGRDGRNPVCKACRAALARAERLVRGDDVREGERRRYAVNPHGKRAAMAAWSKANAEARRQRERERYAQKRLALLAQKAAYRAASRAKIYALNGTRRAHLRCAVPKWANRPAIRAIYAEAARRTLETGVEHHVDHVIPLSHPNVCGLHVPENLQIVEARENLAKSNRWDADAEVRHAPRVRATAAGRAI